MARNLWGQTVTKLDSKGRVNIPSKVRRYLRPEDEDSFLLMRHPSEPCVVAVPITRWEALVDKLEEKLGDTTQLKRLLRRLLYQASEQRIDKQGRLNIPKELIKYGKLDGKVVFLASKDQIELWNEEIYEQKALGEELSAEEKEKLVNIGL